MIPLCILNYHYQESADRYASNIYYLGQKVKRVDEQINCVAIMESLFFLLSLLCLGFSNCVPHSILNKQPCYNPKLDEGVQEVM